MTIGFCTGLWRTNVRIAELDPATVTMGTVDVPAKWAMEGGDIMPEPGEEDAWFAAHAAKAAKEAKAVAS